MNRLDIIKKLLPGFLPLIIFIIADEIWGTKTGLVVAVVFGIGELLLTWKKEKRFDRFIVADTGLLVLMGGISFILNNDIFFKLKPAIIEFIFCVILGISVFSPQNILLMMTKRYMQGMEMSEEVIKKMNQSLNVLFYIFSLHTLLIIFSAFYMSERAWGFISGVLFYIIFGIYMLFELIKNRFLQWKLSKEEWLPVVDEEGNVKSKIPRSEVHKGNKILHPVIHLHVFNNKKEIFLQKRAMNKLVQPGKWDTAVGGHISFGEKMEESLMRETKEELGITDFKSQLIAKYIWESDLEKELVFVFICVIDNPVNIRVNKEEIEDGRFWSISEIRKSLGKNIFTANFEKEFKEIITKL